MTTGVVDRINEDSRDKNNRTPRLLEDFLDVLPLVRRSEVGPGSKD